MDDKNRDTIQQYVGDMVALEGHIEQAIDGQLKEVENDAKVHAMVERFHAMIRGHRDSLKSHLASIGGSESHPIKEAVASIFGMAAGAIDNMRTKGISKALRDDYTAFNHAAIGYAMLHTSAHALGDQKTADVAAEYLRDYAQAVQELNQVIPGVVVAELQEEGLDVQPGAADHAVETLNRSWRDTSPSHTTSPVGRAA